MGDDAILKNAFKVYVDEVNAHLKFVSEFFQEARPCSTEEVYAVMARFHTIKGGAGFFGLKPIAKVAGQLEDLLSKPNVDCVAERAIILPLIDELRALTVEHFS